MFLNRAQSGLGTLDTITILGSVSNMTSFNHISPRYTIYRYSDFLYKVVKFRGDRLGLALHDSSSQPEKRFDSSYSRSRRMVLQYAVCNRWDYFITITVSPERFNRYDLKSVYNVLYQFFKFYRSFLSPNFRFLLIPELHEDGAWHFHGFVAGVLPSHLSEFVRGIHPQKLIDKGYLNWPLVSDLIGYVSLGKLKNPVAAAFYVVKYITKQHANDSFYEHLYYCSRGLSKAAPVVDFYAENAALEQYLTCNTDFCSVGWIRLKDADWSFPFALDGAQPREYEELSALDEAALEAMPLPEPDPDIEEFFQLSLSDLCSL